MLSTLLSVIAYYPMSTVLQRYQHKIDSGEFIADPCQIQAINLLNDIATKLNSGANTSVKGLYIWGDVGRGKTVLMDMFFDSLPSQKKIRLHFHHFMASMHRELNQESGHADPLRIIAKRLSLRCDVLCFDEFFVSDIGDAMILGRLFEALFEFGVTLVATSNITIKRLYEGGLQRQRFEPTILLLQQFTTEFHLDGVEDHRLRHLTYRQTYFTEGEISPVDLFKQVSQQDNIKSDRSICVLGRRIAINAQANLTLWIDFSELCEGPRSALDYIEIAQSFDNIIIANAPQLGGETRSWIRARGTEDGVEATATGERQLNYASQDDATRRFISLVDEMYDQQVCLYLIAAVPLSELYQGGALTFEFKRTFSRLTEMQSVEYLTVTTSVPVSA